MLVGSGAHRAEAETADGRLLVAAVGDSYIAGTGAGNYYPGQGPDGGDDGGWPRVPDGRNCFQSYASYPWLYVQALNRAGVEAKVITAACHGAHVEHLRGQWALLADEKAQADIVLVSAGGNDTGFGGIVEQCILGAPFGTTGGRLSCDATLDLAESVLPAVVLNLGRELQWLSSQAPDAEIVVVGYPDLLSPAHGKCSLTAQGELRIEALFMEYEELLINAVAQLNADEFRYRLVLPSGRFDDRGPCSLSDPWLHHVTNPFTTEGESFHPNQRGSAEYAQLLIESAIHRQIGEARLRVDFDVSSSATGSEPKNWATASGFDPSAMVSATVYRPDGSQFPTEQLLNPRRPADPSGEWRFFFSFPDGADYGDWRWELLEEQSGRLLTFFVTHRRPSLTAQPYALSLPAPPGERVSLGGGPHAHGGGAYGPSSGGVGEAEPVPDRWSEAHALDLSPTVVTASADGVVRYLECGPDRSGLALTVYHGDGWYTFYGHVEGWLVADGERVVRGQPLASPGVATPCGGSATGPHVHWAVLHSGSEPASVDNPAVAVDLTSVEIEGFSVELAGNAETACVVNQASRQRSCTGDFVRVPTRASLMSNGPADDQVFRLYRAVFGREPDRAGFDFWVARYRSGLSLEQMADAFSSSPEFRERFGVAVSDEELIDLLYRNVLGRSGDPAGVEFWLGERSRGLSVAGLLVEFSESDENVQASGTIR